MKPKSSAHYQREYRRRLREQGLVKKEVWIHPANAKWLARLEQQLRDEADLTLKQGDEHMTYVGRVWTTKSLCEALVADELFTSGRASIELMEGVEPAVHIVMKDFGDLPVFLTVSGEQIIVEAVLWSTQEVRDVAAFNDAVLRTHKYFPLSTISLDVIGENADYYHMFGALSSTSLLQNVVFEIEILASNVIQATEAYSEFLNVAIEA